MLSVVGFGVTLWVGWQAGKLREYFFNRVRIGEVLPELSSESQGLIKSLLDWDAVDGRERESHLALSRIKGRLANLKGKLKADDRKAISDVLSKIERRNFFLKARDVSSIRFEEAWAIATALDGMIVQIESGHRDANWRQR